MNPLIMNNNMIGINSNQQNLMDENAIRIKNIIQPYENKIKELEEIIRNKDFQITVLTQKLNTYEKKVFFIRNQYKIQIIFPRI